MKATDPRKKAHSQDSPNESTFEERPFEKSTFEERTFGERPVEGLVFIELPAPLSRKIGAFTPDPSIPLPVETLSEPERFDTESITAEAILAGMLRFIAWQPEHKNARYYRDFVLAVHPGIVQELLEAGSVKAKNQEWDIAEEIFLALEFLDDRSSPARLCLATLYEDRMALCMEEGNSQAATRYEALALERYEDLLNREAGPTLAYFNAGFFFLRLHDYDRAASLFESYAAIGEDRVRAERSHEILAQLRELKYTDSLFKEAHRLIRDGREAEGIEKASLFVDRHKDLWNGWFMLGWGHRRAGHWEEGLAAFKESLRLGAEGVDVHNEMAICLLELGKMHEARLALEAALALEPENVKIIVNLGTLFLKNGQYDQASGFFRTALSIDPEDETARYWLDKAQLRESTDEEPSTRP